MKALQKGVPAWEPIEIRETDGPGHAPELARQAADDAVDIVLSVGGDGTANEVASSLLRTETALGLVPVGSGNGLARSLRIPLDPARAILALASGPVRLMDVGRINGRPFLNVAGAGLDAVVGADFQAHGDRGGRRGIMTYVGLTLKRAFSYRAARWRLDAGDQLFEGHALIVAFVNGRQYGGGAILAPNARFDDNRLDVVVIEDASVVEITVNAPRLFLGTIGRFRRYRHFSATSATLTGPQRFTHHRDGEPEKETSRLEVSIDPLALRIIVPSVTSDDPNGPFAPEPPA